MDGEVGWDFLRKGLIQKKQKRKVDSDFFLNLKQFKGLQEGEDILSWQKHSSGMYTVSSTYKDMNQVGSQNSLWHWKHI